MGGNYKSYWNEGTGLTAVKPRLSVKNVKSAKSGPNKSSYAGVGYSFGRGKSGKKQKIR